MIACPLMLTSPLIETPLLNSKCPSLNQLIAPPARCPSPDSLSFQLGVIVFPCSSVLCDCIVPVYIPSALIFVPKGDSLFISLIKVLSMFAAGIL